MKISRTRKAHKNLCFFVNNFGFRQPYQVLVDGTLCFSALKGKINLKDQLPKYLGAEVKLLTTQCVILETEKLGPALFGAMLIVKQFPVHRCGHDDRPISGSTCILSMLGKKNKTRYIVATQDRDLQDRVRKIPGAPLIYIHQRTPTLEAPSPASLKVAEKFNEAKFSSDQQPGELVSEVRKRVMGEEEQTSDKPTHKRKRRSGPNPLSCKKKKAKPGTNQANASASSGKKKRSRKRVKIPQHVKEHLLSNASQQQVNSAE
ncbi:hypothetical protein B566_EDAN009273 [Ephemera danica]|nr:hypothetical protein B566_EDAN009273 [Ephemera danica]